MSVSSKYTYMGGTYATYKVESTNVTHLMTQGLIYLKFPICTNVQQNKSSFSSLEYTDNVELETIVDLDFKGHKSAYMEIIGSLLLKLESIYNVSG